MVDISSQDLWLSVPIRRHPNEEATLDPVVIEEPLEIRVDGEPLAVVMRTPGQDRALAVGFLVTEGIIDDISDIAASDHCRDPHQENRENIFLVNLAAGSSVDLAQLERARRAFFASSSCGLCGKRVIENIHQAVHPHREFRSCDAAEIQLMLSQARAHQPLFERTGGSHAAMAIGAHDVVASAEDVGRHNAVDKVVGLMVLAGPEHTAHTLWVSGRASFEMVQKALLGGFRTLVCVGAPTSLAVELARSCRLTLIGFASAKRWNIYTP